MRCTLALLALSACEREGEGRFTPPHVGQEQDVTTVGELTAGLGANARHGSYHTILHTTALAVDGLAITKMRVVVLAESYEFAGALESARSGIYELSTPGGFAVTKQGGELTAAERKYFADWGPTMNRRGTRNVLERTLRVGERYTPTDEERDSLGFPRSHNLVVVPRVVDRDSVMFDITYDADMDSPGIVAHVRGWLRFGAHASEADQTGDVTADGHPVGALHWADTRVND